MAIYLRIPFYELERATDSNLLSKVTDIYQRLTSHTSIFTTPTPAMPAYKALIDEFSSAAAAASTGDRVLVGQRKLARKALLQSSAQLSYYVLLTANGDAQVLLASGFPLPKPPQPKDITTPPPPEIQPGQQSGEVYMVGKSIRGAASYMHQYSTDPELKEESWMTMSCTSAKCKLTGLTPGKVYYFRIGVIGTRDQILFSAVVSKMVA